MSRINRVPWGLQSLLGSKNFGVNPAELVPAVAPSLEMAPFLNYELIRTAGALTTFTAVGQTATITVPANEAWMLYAVNGDVQLVGTTERFYCCVEVLPKNADTTSYVCLSTHTETENRAAESGFSFPTQLPQPFLLGPGSEIRIRLIDGNVTSIPAGVSALYARYEV